jgi:hypothetical protein
MWAQVAAMLVGVWLMAAPAVLGYTGPARTNDHVVGPLAATFACVAIWEATRPVRWANLVLGAWLVLAPWWLGYDRVAAANSVTAGVALVTLSVVRGRLKHRFGGGWSALWVRGAPAAEG